MTDLLRIPANSQAYLFAARDAAADTFDVKKFAYGFLNGIPPWDLPDQVIEMLGSEIGDGYDTVEAPCEEGYVWFDPTKYDGNCTFFFEANGWNIDFDWDTETGPDLPLKLVDSSGTVYATITLVNTGYVDMYTMGWYDFYFYQVAFTPPATAKKLTVQLPSGPNWGEDAVALSAARIRIRQTQATKTRTMIPMLHGWGVGFDSPDPSYWRYDSSEVGDIKAVWLEANADDGVSTFLYNVTDGVTVAGSTTPVGSYYGDLVRVQIPVENLIDGKTYRVEAGPYAAWLCLELDPCTKFATWNRIGMQSTDEYWNGGRDEAEHWSGYDLYVDNQTIAKLNLPPGAKAYFEATGQVGPASGSPEVALRLSSGNHDWYGTTLSSHTLSFSGAKEMKRTADIASSLVNGSLYDIWWSGVVPSPSNYACVLPCGSFIVITAEP